MIFYVLLLSLAAVILNLTLPIMAGLYIVSDLGGSPYLTPYTVTFFCMGNILGVPLGKPLATRLSPIQLYLVCLCCMTFFSWQCAITNNFFYFILFRFLEGWASGPLFILIGFSLIPTLAPNVNKDYIFSLMLLCFSMVPIIGGAYGGFIAYNYHWRWLFYSNIPLCLFLILYVGRHYRQIHMPVEAICFDKIGYFLYFITIVFIGTALTTGQELDWFRSSLICFLLVGGGISLVFFILKSWSSPYPIIDLKLLKNFYFSFALIYVSFVFAIYFGTIILLSLWLKLDVNYTPNWIALLLITSLLCAWIPIVIQFKVFDPRIPLLAALFFIGISCFYATYFNIDIDFGRIAFSRFLLGIGLATFLAPLFRLSLQYHPPEKAIDCVCFFHVARLIGSGLGAALFIILWHRRVVFFNYRLGSSLTAFSAEVQRFFQKAKFIHIQGKQALGELNYYTSRQATALALDDCFYLMGWITLLLILFLLASFLLKRARPHS